MVDTVNICGPIIADRYKGKFRYEVQLRKLEDKSDFETHCLVAELFNWHYLYAGDYVVFKDGVVIARFNDLRPFSHTVDEFLFERAKDVAYEVASKRRPCEISLQRDMLVRPWFGGFNIKVKKREKLKNC